MNSKVERVKPIPKTIREEVSLIKAIRLERAITPRAKKNTGSRKKLRSRFEFSFTLF